jgi:NarL family two-component system response regulator LiaR
MTRNRPLRVLVVDDHDIVLRGVASFLEGAVEDIEVKLARSGVEAIRECDDYCPDIALMDIHMPGMDGIETTEKLLDVCPNTKIIALTSSVDQVKIQGMIRAGAVGYLLKTSPLDDLVHILHATEAGRMTFSPELAAVLLSPMKESPNPYHLTKREYEVLELIVQGYNNPQISETLHISRSTVGYHVSSLLAKLNAQNRVEAAQIAIREHLIRES